MQTHLGKLADIFKSLHSEAIYLAGRDHESDDLKALLKNAGGLLETFLKSNFHHGKDRWGLEKLIDRLADFGIPINDINTLHILRTRYNLSKHDPTYAAAIDDVVGVLEKTLAVLKTWIGKQLGTSENATLPTYRRRIWLASWDHFVHGDGEVHLFAPVLESDYSFPPGIDIIYLKGLSWPDVLVPLGNTVSAAEGLIPQKFLEFWEKEGDFAGARVFDGSYRDLIRTLAKSELKLDILPFLKRENDKMAMFTAAAFASVDIFNDIDLAEDDDNSIEKIIQHCANEYAAPTSSRYVKSYAARFVKLFHKIPDSKKRQITGPRFVTNSKFNQLKSSAICADPSVMVTSAFELAIEL